MVMIKDKKGKERYSFKTKLYEFIERCKEKTTEEDSMVLGILWGKVGSGKSVLAQHLGYAIDPTLSISRVCFNKDEFINAVLDSKKKVIIGDEGISLFFSRNVMTKEGRLMAEIMAQIRQKNLCVIVCIPKLLSVDKEILSEANFVGYVWESEEEKNGRQVRIKGNLALFPKITGDDYASRVITYLEKEKKKMKHNYMPTPYLTQHGNPIGKTFKKPWYPVGELHYRRKKESILDKYRCPEKKTKADIISVLKKNNPELTYKQIGKGLGISREWANTLGKRGVNTK